MPAEKLSVSLPMSLVQFIEIYKAVYQYKSRSLVI
jgi:metal-responsive CopG/Arc/MetJ family transcriptional regulator